MSRRPTDKAQQNQQTIKSLLKLEANKNCADCKKNKHPRWASWNLGIFICIRCSGIHRGMGTHISRVKSVDLDAWTDEQLQSVLRWGNARANKYWEAKLAPGHVPSEAKIENFIRTKYESKRWVMDGPMPDPATLGDGGDDDVPLNVVQDRAKLDRSAQRTTGGLARPPASAAPQASFDLIGADDTPTSPPMRPNTTSPAQSAPPRQPPPPKANTPSQLLGGLDFLGAPPERPSSAAAKPGGMSRPDLKQSILSLYASAPKPQPQSPPQSSHDRQSSFGGMQQGGGASKPSAFGDLNDAFGGLSFGGPSAPPPQQQQHQSQQSFGGMGAFGGMTQMSPQSNKATPAAPQMTSPPLTGGGFFDAGPKPPPKPAAPKSSNPPPLATRKISNASDGFGDFTSGGAATSPQQQKPPPPPSNSIGLLDFTSSKPPGQPAQPSYQPDSSVFNLSSQKPAAPAQPKPATGSMGGMQASNPWGDNAWADPTPAPAPAKPTSPQATAPPGGGSGFGWGSSPTESKPAPPPQQQQQTDWGSSGLGGGGGWGDDGGFGSSSAAAAPKPKVTADEDFGGWGSMPEPAPAPAKDPMAMPKSKPFGGGSEDLFSNVWE